VRRGYFRRVTVVVLAGVAPCLIARTPAGAETARQFENFVQVSPFGDGEYWFLRHELRYEVWESGGLTVPVPEGFVTDFASIPRPFWSILPTWGQYGPASIVHDYLYWDQRCTREQADAIMLLAMEDSHVSRLRRLLIFWALRMGGAWAWRSNAKLRAAYRERTIPREYAPQENAPDLTWKVLQDRIKAGGHVPDPRPSTDPAPLYCAQAERLWRQVQAEERRR
jgi:hypothetical protein